MYKSRKIGLGLAMAFGLMLTVPVLAVQPSQSAQNHSMKPAKPPKMAKAMADTKPMMMAAPDMSGPDPCVKTLADIHEAQSTVTQLQQLGAEIKARHAQLEANATASADEGAPMKCPACGMMMPMTATAKMTKAVKYNGKTYYCCAGCDMSATADKE